MESSLEELVNIFRDEKEFSDILTLFKGKYRSRGKIVKGTKVVLSDLSPNQLQTLEGFFGEIYRDGQPITITAAKFEKAIMKTKYKNSFEGLDMNDLLQLYFLGNLTSKSEDKHNFEKKKELFFQTFLRLTKRESPFYRFVSFISSYRNASFIHLMYKNKPNSLNQLLNLLKEIFDNLPLGNDTFLPLFSHRLTGDFYALAPNSDGGKMMLFALQVLNHLDKGRDINLNPDKEQITHILYGYRILFCPQSNRLARRLWTLEDQNGEVQKNHLIPLKKIGFGGFAEVYRVFDLIAKKEMACKVLFEKSVFIQEHGKEGEDYLLRFKREVRLLREKKSHINIIEVDKIKLDKEPFLFTMPLAETSLEKWLELNPAVSEEIKLRIFKDILCGASYLHNNFKISHRDLAPHNILIFSSSDGTIVAKIADFGLAKDDQSLSSITRHSNMSYGRAAFTAPEQKESLKNADSLSDIYSLGAIMYFIFSGESPERGFRSLIKYQPIVGKAMEEDRSKRYQTVQELIDDFNNSLAQSDYLFGSLRSYELKDFFSDVKHVLKCLSTANIEESNEVVEKFVKPFLSIPNDVLMECAKHETVMVPFIQIAKVNIIRVIDCNEGEWSHLSEHLNVIYKSSRSLVAQISTLNLILVVALEKKVPLAQAILVDIMGNLAGQDKLSQEIAHIIGEDFLNSHDLLISLLKDTPYPSDIRFVLNDY
ncbi:protein kinase [Paenibacillus sp. FSL H7-0331]|uniref:protein kinase domain-containing protein n=1 Tax=Paenibacillus sp. FSL H7-0331 TaxID=1920421 RepID=UPI00096D5A63|nr:protein kinase [Paenibacillus sp. FSL H7-0331]OME99057.1 serine/threonine protein kinase [Paenibacillus sp. FSL H7-0331]